MTWTTTRCTCGVTFDDDRFGFAITAHLNTASRLTRLFPGLADMLPCPAIVRLGLDDDNERAYVTCAMLGYPDLKIGDLITHLNDDHLWSREAIADWLEEAGLELPLNPAATAVQHGLPGDVALSLVMRGQLTSNTVRILNGL